MTGYTGDVRWGMIGTGSIATGRGGKALSMAPNSRLAHVMGRSLEKARACAEAHGVERSTTNPEELFADPEVDAVYVATPPNAHAEYTVRSAEAGKHVLCEKPMALAEDECCRMIDACDRNGVQLMIAYYRRFYPVVQRMHELLSSPGFGEPVYARVLTSSMYHGRPTWKTDPSVGGGGYLPDNGSHRLDLLAYLLGDVSEVSAFVGTNYHAIEGDDSTAMLLRFANCAYATVQFSWNTAERTDELEIGGTQGRAGCRNLEAGDLEVTIGGETQSLQLPNDPVSHVPVVAHFVECIREGKPNMLPGEEGVKATRMILAAQQSARLGRAMPLG